MTTAENNVAAQAGDEPMGICCYGGPPKPKSACASCAAWQVSPRATADVERLNWLVHHGAAMRIDPMTNQWYIETVHHTGISCVDDRIRFDTANAAIDAAIATTKPGA